VDITQKSWIYNITVAFLPEGHIINARRGNIIAYAGEKARYCRKPVGYTAKKLQQLCVRDLLAAYSLVRLRYMVVYEWITALQILSWLHGN
jgi:hypothetical protein